MYMCKMCVCVREGMCLPAQVEACLFPCPLYILFLLMLVCKYESIQTVNFGTV